MNPMKMKSKVLSEIMDLMDQEDGKKLMNHPKLVAAKVTIAKPVGKAEGVPKLEDEGQEIPEMDEMKEGPEEEKAEGESEGLLDILEDVMQLKEVPQEIKAKLQKFLK